ncbi:replication protein P [Edwardsiella tarda]|uniref:replication protein P n=1 Tax=Edwardsiella tarda TaxID=636 RepID=UPI00063BE339|nr:replication protein P [Edwardsiella tarda]AKH89027.1 DNA replication protein [Edwardsiella tarda]
MKSLVSAVQRRDAVALSRMAGQPLQARVVNGNAEKLVDVLFENLLLLFPASRNTVFAAPDEVAAMKRQWITAFAEGGITTLEQVKAGVSMARQHGGDFWPSCGRFMEWCREGVRGAGGLPSDDEVLAEFHRYARDKARFASPEAFDWVHPVMYWVVLDVRQRMYRYNYTEAEVLRAIKAQMKQWAKDMAAGKVIPQPVVRIADCRRPKTAAELAGNAEHYQSVGLAALAAIRQKLRESSGEGAV